MRDSRSRSSLRFFPPITRPAEKLWYPPILRSTSKIWTAFRTLANAVRAYMQYTHQFSRWRYD